MRVLEPRPGVLAFYDGRPSRATLEAADWVEYDLALGIASYALVDGEDALVYDTHASPDRGRLIREELERRRVRKLQVVLSHWHLDHVAGGSAFAGCEVVATQRTAAHLAHNREAIEAGTCLGPPPVTPLVTPTRTFAERLKLRVGTRTVELIHFDIHSDDAAVIWLPDERILLAGDTLEDTVTFVDDPGSLERHLGELERLRALGAERILPAHGDPEVIGAGGYAPNLIDATSAYIRRLLESREDEHLRSMSLRDFVSDELSTGALVFHEPYEAVHRENVEKVAGR